MVNIYRRYYNNLFLNIKSIKIENIKNEKLIGVSSLTLKEFNKINNRSGKLISFYGLKMTNKMEAANPDG